MFFQPVSMQKWQITNRGQQSTDTKDLHEKYKKSFKTNLSQLNN